MSWVGTVLCVGLLLSPAAARAGEGFDVIVLGALGGLQDGNLSSYLIRPHGASAAIACDAGSLVNGLRVAQEKGAFAGVSVPANATDSVVGHVLRNHIKGYLISHPHLDHVAGLVIASPDDSAKTIYGLPSVTAGIEQTYFNWAAWPNMLDRGKPPQLKKYHVQDLRPGESTPLSGTAMTVTAFPLRHGGTESTAFLVESGGDAILCLGDTGPDEVEKATNLHDMWTAIADKVRQKRLKAVIMEVSYTNDRPDAQLFGHLTPDWLLRTLRGLDQAAGAGALKGLPVVVSHIKYSLDREQPQAVIRRELESGNDLGLAFVIPEQGASFHFR
ncbi:MAG: 3',5'-cyclic-nucleotide phosphodiesterase [Microvirga sp.]